jgi:endonuclease/exonuclease/phosphatase family metal-dependent hydrolase
MMKPLKLTISLISLLLVTVVVFGQTHTIMFYNVENLYDTENDPNTLDDDFTPEGSYKWDDKKYWVKIDRLTEVFQEIAKASGGFPILIGMCEIENRSVLMDLVHGQRIQAVRYQIVHYDSPDARGVDVAFLYRSDIVEYVSSKPVPVKNPENEEWRTRDILWFTGKIDGEVFHFFANHWPSRRGGERASAPLRELAASILRHIVDSIQNVDATQKIVIMGDFNDDPNNNSVHNVLRAKGDQRRLQGGDLFNPFFEMHKAGHGTLPWDDAWNLFDMVIVSQNMINNSGGFQLYRPARNKFYGFIFNRPFLMQQEGRFRNHPWRTYVGNTYQGGYSDHFPVYIHISK